MSDLLEGIQQAFWLMLLLDADLVEISLRSLRVTLSALFVSCLIALPLAAILAVRRFKYRRLIISTLNALMGLPPVVVGLIVYILLSRSGPFGVLGLLFTTHAMVIAQVIIITPLITSIAHQSLRELWSEYHDLSDFYEHVKMAAHQNIVVGWTARVDDSLACGFWTRDWRSWCNHDCWGQY